VPDLHPVAGWTGDPYRSLLAPARAARLVLGIAGVLALALAGALIARVALAVHAIAVRLPASTPATVSTLTDRILAVALIAVVVAVVGLGRWLARADQNLASLHLTRRGHWSNRVRHAWILWAAPVATIYLVTSPLAGLDTQAGDGWISDAVGVIAALVIAAACHVAEEIVGVVTVAQAHRAEAVAAVVARAETSYSSSGSMSAATSG
jgi:hypothetical protein